MTLAHPTPFLMNPNQDYEMGSVQPEAVSSQEGGMLQGHWSRTSGCPWSRV